jgi:hypothetical protein
VRLFLSWRVGGNPTEVGIFISYSQANRRWAERIAWVLEEHGHYKVLVQAWDFVPDSNWIQEMQVGTRAAAHTIAVLSDAYLNSQIRQRRMASRLGQRLRRCPTANC